MKSLSLNKRHTYILERLAKEDEIRVIDLSNELNVSSVTIRKDLKLLEDKKLLFRTHGNVSKTNPYTQDVHVFQKKAINVIQKQRIAQKAANMICPNDAIIMASGTTLLYMAQVIEAQEHLTILTSALNIAIVLTEKPMIDVIQLGGIVRKTSTSVGGSFTENMLSQFACSQLFLGVDGIDVHYGCTTSNLMEANVNQLMIEAAQRTIILADSSKFGKKGFGRICSFDVVDKIITDDHVNEKTVKILEDMGIEVIIA